MRAGACTVSASSVQLTLDEAFDLARTHQRDGRVTEATRLCDQILGYEPEHALSLNLRAVLCLEQGDWFSALRWAQSAVEAEPSVAEFHNTLGEAHRGAGDHRAAQLAYRRSLELEPEQHSAYHNLALVFSAKNRPAEAAVFFREALRRQPDDCSTLHHWAHSLREAGEVEQAELAYEEALEKCPSAGLRVRQATLLPVVLSNGEHIDPIREHYRASLEALQGQVVLDDPVLETAYTGFYLAYHGRNDRDLQERVNRFFMAACPALSREAPHCQAVERRERIKVGIVSRFFKWHSIGRTCRGLIANLSRKHFEVVTVRAEPIPEDDAFARWIDDHSERVLTLSGRFEDSRDRLEAQAFDILYYQDIGMDPLTYFLACCRLAPVQCVAAGHPVTTGIGNLDYYISSRWFEPAGAQAHYSERLIQLDAPHWYYYRPARIEKPVDRARWGLPKEATLYLCPQTLFKLHPDFDSILRDVLERNCHARLVLVDAHCPQWKLRLLERFRRTLHGLLDRIIVVPPQPWKDFLALLATADVVLDPIHFGGYNTTLEAFSVGTPVVTLPGEFQRGRHCAGMYSLMNLEELIAGSPEHYEELVTRLGTDASYRRRMSESIEARSAVLFEDHSVIAEHERFFLEVMGERAVRTRSLQSAIEQSAVE